MTPQPEPKKSGPPTRGQSGSNPQRSPQGNPQGNPQGGASRRSTDVERGTDSRKRDASNAGSPTGSGGSNSEEMEAEEEVERMEGEGG